MEREDEPIRELREYSASGVAEPSPWVPEAELRRLLAEAPADAGLLEDVSAVRSC
jgi:hypothetical protein